MMIIIVIAKHHICHRKRLIIQTSNSTKKNNKQQVLVRHSSFVLHPTKYSFIRYSFSKKKRDWLQLPTSSYCSSCIWWSHCSYSNRRRRNRLSWKKRRRRVLIWEWEGVRSPKLYRVGPHRKWSVMITEKLTTTIMKKQVTQTMETANNSNIRFMCVEHYNLILYNFELFYPTSR